MDFYPYCIREDEDCVITVHVSADHPEPIGRIWLGTDRWFIRNDHGRQLPMSFATHEEAIKILISEYEEDQAQREFWCTP